MVSLDVVSLFTAIPVKKACTYIRNKLEDDETLQSRTNLATDDVSRYLNLFFLTVSSCIMIVSANKYMVVPWEAQLVQSSPTSVWRLLKNQPYRPRESLPKSGNNMLMTVLSLSRKIAYPNFTTN